MQITLALCLPRDAASVPVLRRVAAQALRSIGFHGEDVADVELALTEAASNVLRHSQDGEEYEVRLELADDRLTLEVVDAGEGFEGDALGRADASDTAEAGRGIQLMRAMSDEVGFEYRPGHGSVVRLVKTLRLQHGAPLGVLRSRTGGLEPEHAPPPG